MSLTRRRFLGSAAFAAGGVALASVPTGLAAQGSGAAPAAFDADVIVIGAGLSGLHAAQLLEDGGLTVLVLEGDTRVGGRVRTLLELPEQPEAGGSEVGAYYARVLDPVSYTHLTLPTSDLV